MKSDIANMKKGNYEEMNKAYAKIGSLYETDIA